MTIRYDNIHLHAQRDQSESDTFKQWLEDNNVSFVYLGYQDASDDLHAISTWFADEPDFTTAPVLTFNQVMWEDPHSDDQYSKAKFAKSSSELPSDFLTLAERTD